ncbi:MAG: hypothetical protein U1E76_13355 [Planctomycetota bacterium]
MAATGSGASAVRPVSLSAPATVSAPIATITSTPAAVTSGRRIGCVSRERSRNGSSTSSSNSAPGSTAVPTTLSGPSRYLSSGVAEKVPPGRGV